MTPTENSDVSLSPGSSTWSFPVRLFFRFAFSYLSLYIVTFAPRIFHTPIGRTYVEVWNPLVAWVARHLLSIAYPVEPPVGDTAFEYVLIVSMALTAAATAAVWSMFDRKRQNYAMLHEWLRLAVRLWLATFLISYGAGKVFPGQFLLPSPARYIGTYGDSNAMGLLWTLMGSSPGYQSFAGAIELSAGLLLIIPRLTVLGSLLASAAMANVLAMNAAYDVQVKIFSAHLFGAAVFLLAPDLRRLWEFFILRHTTSIRVAPPLFRRAGWNHWALGLQLAFGLYATLIMLLWGHQRAKDRDELASKTPLYGIWMVDDFVVDGTAHPPLTTDKLRWQRVVIESPSSAAVQMMDGTLQRCAFKLDQSAHAAEFHCHEPEHDANFTYVDDGAGTLLLTGKESEHTMTIRMHHVVPDFVLDKRGIRWVHKFPPFFR